MWNYVEYMLYLKFSDWHELSTFNSFAKVNLEKKNVCFLPSYQDNFDKEEIIKENIKDENEENSRDLIDEISDLEKSENFE